ncbi:MAG: lysophospholipid acyltransferase family protein [Bacteroidales bacterium]|nr:lysophospholipid acyltransferase family protein [Bacteroidales bacterium]MBR4148480.1 lysophospholipid acyltransferase family protein [Bacteroidales bacterium]
MKRIGFWLVKCVAYLIALTPFSLLYLKSDIYAFLLYHVVRYRRKVVRDNLVKSFPEKTTQEIKKIEKQFYRNFCDLFMETCKMMRLKPEEMSQHVTFANPELLQSLYQKGRSVFTAIPHSGNWEWYGKLMHKASNHKVSAIYKKLKNPYFDVFMKKLRKNFDLDREEMIEASTALKSLVRRKDLLNAVLIVSDQSPRGVASDYWTDFLHRDTCWFYGLEKMAKLLDYAVVFVEMKREGRGRYSVTFDLICEDPQTMEEGAIMEQYVRHVERFIQDNPDNWLWSHRRWKHTRQVQA